MASRKEKAMAMAILKANMSKRDKEANRLDLVQNKTINIKFITMTNLSMKRSRNAEKKSKVK